jgi:Xaa-Pro aminopeptidase
MSNQHAIQLTAPASVYRARRGRLAATLERPLVLAAGHGQARNYPTNPFRFRAASTYLYFGGPPLEHAAWLIEPGSDGDWGCTLLRYPEGPDDALWEGELPQDQAMVAAAGLRPDGLAEPTDLRDLLQGRPAAAITPSCPQTLDWIAGLGLAQANHEESLAVIEMRLIKDEHEIAALRYAGEIGAKAHLAAMAATAPGRGEADVAAAYTAVVIAHQCDIPFVPIITVRGEVLHGRGHPNPLEAGALMLVDAGAEEPGGYSSDITRTYPVNARWTGMQRSLYETVLRAEREGVAACVPGRRFREIHDLAARVICEGLVEADLLRGHPDDLAARFAHTLFFPHGLGHLVGLDGHDMEDFGDLAGYARGRKRRPEFGNKYLRLDRDLEPGMVVTVEPGIYIVPAIWRREDLVQPFADVVNRAAVDTLLNEQFGGIRVEDTVLVRPDGGPENLTADVTADPDEMLTRVGTGN